MERKTGESIKKKMGGYYIYRIATESLPLKEKTHLWIVKY
jgi:hypothetical protein